MPQTDTTTFIPFFLSFLLTFFVTLGLITWFFLKFWFFDASFFLLDYLKCLHRDITSICIKINKTRLFSNMLLLQFSYFDPLAQFFLETVKFPHAFEFLVASSTVQIILVLLAVLAISLVLIFVYYYLILSSSFTTICGLSYYYQISNLFYVVRSISRENLSNVATRYIILLDWVFYSVLLLNFLGLIPYSFTITGQLSFTLFVSTSFFVGLNILCIRLNGLNTFNLFLPSGVPVFISPFLVLIEIISYFARLFSLGIRLFANMMAGHALTIILSSYTWAFLFNDITIGLLSFFIVYCVIGLEFMVAFLQAYVFTMLVSIYISDVTNGH